MASKQDKDQTDIMDAAAPRPEATPQAPPRVLSDSEQRQADEYQRALAQQGVTQDGAPAEPAQRIDETQPGGQYQVDGRTVDAEGRTL